MRGWTYQNVVVTLVLVGVVMLLFGVHLSHN